MKDIRIHKFLADCGVASRRAAEKMISDGKVTVNGLIAEIGQTVDPETDEIKLNGKKIVKKSNDHVYVLLNKPAGFLSTAKDDRGRKTVCDLVNIPGRRLFPAGRLDMYTEGLLILSDDGDAVYRLTHPKCEVKKVYVADITCEVNENLKTELSEPITIDGKETSPAEVEVISSTQNGSVVRFTISEGRNRQIRRLCERSRLKIRKLKRVRIGEIEDYTLAAGKWRYLSFEETEYLKGL